MSKIVEKSDYGLRLIERIYEINKHKDISTSILKTPKLLVANEVSGMQHFLNLAVPFVDKLVADGSLGPLTRSKLTTYLVAYQKYENEYKIKNSNYSQKRTLYDTGMKYVGQEEIRGNLGFKDKMFLSLMQSVDWRKTEAWCMYFVKIVVMEWLKEGGWTEISPKILNGSTQKSLRNLIAFNEQTNPGTVVFFHNPNYNTIMFYENRKNSSTGHVGLPKNHELFLNNNTHKITLRTIEGNTTNADSIDREGHIVAINDRLIESGPKSSLILQGFLDFGYLLKLTQGGYVRV